MVLLNEELERLRKALDQTMRFHDISKIDDTKYTRVMKTLTLRKPVLNPFILGFDTEWNPETGQLLSVQFAVERDGGLFSKVYYVSNLNVRSLLNHVLTFLDEADVGDEIRKMKKVRFYLIAHFAQAEISKVTDYMSEFKLRTFNKAMSAEASVGALEDQEYEDEMRQVRNVKHGKYFLKILDLYGYFSQALSVVGELVGLPKLELDRTQIHVVFEKERARFEEYAKRDAEICVRAFNQLRRIFVDKFGLDVLYYPTTAGLAAAIFRNHFLKEPITPFRTVARVYKKQEPDATWVENTVEEPVFDGSLDVRHMALQCYWGGRAECYARGFVKGDFEYYDVASLYPSSSLLQPLPNKDTDWIHFTRWDHAKKELEGFCHVRFQFPSDCKYPCLPVMPEWASKLYFPLKGESYCTISEVRTAVKLGAEILKIDGWGFRPSTSEKNHVLANFMRHFMALKKSEPKGTLRYEMWKLMINSLIGKFCQRSPEYDVGHMVAYMQSSGVPYVSDYKVRRLFREAPNVGPCWSPEWATLILGKARSLMAEFIAKGSLFCSTDSGLFPKGTDLNCDALNELRSIESDFVKENDGDSILLVRARMYALLKNGEVIKCARHGTVATKEEFAKIVKENLRAGHDLKQMAHKTHLATLKDVARKGAKLGQEEQWERQIRWEWDDKRELVKPGINIWTDFSDTMPKQELPEYPVVTGPSKVTAPKQARRELKIGRPPALTPEQIAELKKLHQDGWSTRRLAKYFKVGVATIQRYLAS